jgi:regulatory protein
VAGQRSRSQTHAESGADGRRASASQAAGLPAGRERGKLAPGEPRARHQGESAHTGPSHTGPSHTGPAHTGPGDQDRRGRPDADPAAPDADPEAIARQICLRMLTVAPRTTAQLAAALRRRGVPEDAAAAVLARFAEVKLIDDAMFARAWVDSRHHSRGLAGRALGAELRQRGVASDDIQAALHELSPDVELDTARELVARRLPSTAGMPAQARMRRLVGMLARKGYGSGLAFRVVREALEAARGDGPVPGCELDDLPEPDDDDEAAEI